MTHLGINSAVAAAEKGYETVCYDPDADRIAALARQELPVAEPALAELLTKNAYRITFTSDPGKIAACDVVYVSPDVPTDEVGQSDLREIVSLIGQMEPLLDPDAVIVVLSQVPPGFTRGRACAGGRLFYQVETLIFGRAVERALRPERFIVGCADPECELPEAFAHFLASFGCPILRMRYESAELAKISINMCLVASISVANTLAELCESIGADWSEIVPALKLDKRIGQFAYLAPGLGIAGGNLERDLATVCRLADQYGTDAGVVRASQANSRHRRDWVLRTLYREVLGTVEEPVIGVLGLAYKQDTHSTKNSPSIALLEHLNQYRVRVYDPVVSATPPHPLCHVAVSELDACEGVDVLVVMTPWRQFGNVDPAQMAQHMRGALVVDPYAVLNAAACRAVGLRYLTLGVQH
jgi:UDPglucose 6-dehydrogenase